MNRLDATFARLAQENRTGLFPYLCAGYPTLDATERLVRACVDHGADGLELGVPFSDPLADGATIQHAGEIALRNGVSLKWTVALVGQMRAAGIEIPIALMGYYNPIHRYGVEQLVADAAAAGVDSFIVPDLPSHEARRLAAAAAAHGLYVVEFVAPTATDERLQEVDQVAGGFVYCVSLLGTTGARSTVSSGLPEYMTRVRRKVRQPLVIGFGIATPAHVSAVRAYGDGVIVGAAIVNLLEATAPEQQEVALGTYIASLRAACDGQPVTTA